MKKKPAKKKYQSKISLHPLTVDEALGCPAYAASTEGVAVDAAEKVIRQKFCSYET